MTNHMIFYFCGTGRVVTNQAGQPKRSGKPDTCSGFLEAELSILRRKHSLLGEFHAFNGCDIGRWNNPFGATAHGTGARAKEALKIIEAYFKQSNPTIPLKINAIGHSRGCISALKLVEYIGKAKNNLASKVSVVLDLKDTVPGDMNSTNSIGSSVAKRLADMSKYRFVRLAHLTYADQNGRNDVNSFGFQPLMPKFSAFTRVEVDSIIGNHGAFAEVYKEYPGAYHLVNANSMELILDHADIEDEAAYKTIRKMQLTSYKLMLDKKIRNRLSNVTDRKLHYDGKISSTGYKNPASLNTRHRKLQLAEDIVLANDLVALEVFAPRKYSDFDALALLSDSGRWVEEIFDLSHSISTRTMCLTLQQVFRDSSYYPKLGESQDTLDAEMVRNILAAKIREHLRDPRLTSKDLKTYLAYIESGRRKMSINRNQFVYEAGGRDKVFERSKTRHEEFERDLKHYRKHRSRREAIVSDH
ncbi:hypothetical protein M9194_16970 [Vibrio sp. S4M6]|uniref:hypothetical protein n=1 Tax=Vibrio sinus TaxID=2946865 RepID=UPI00202A0401|nr:hypothetical protein [Vibrio sinus]MCL9783123.1 hypothetical protein [Vibrio sinus]